jgi:hypothetical protein
MRNIYLLRKNVLDSWPYAPMQSVKRKNPLSRVFNFLSGWACVQRVQIIVLPDVVLIRIGSVWFFFWIGSVFFGIGLIHS